MHAPSQGTNTTSSWSLPGAAPSVLNAFELERGPCGVITRVKALVSGVDKTIRTFDMRNFGQPLQALPVINCTVTADVGKNCFKETLV